MFFNNKLSWNFFSRISELYLNYILFLRFFKWNYEGKGWGSVAVGANKLFWGSQKQKMFYQFNSA